MAKKTVYIFCNEKELQEEVCGLLSELREGADGIGFFLLNSEANLSRRLGSRKSGIDALVIYNKNIGNAVDLIIGLEKEEREKIGAVVLARFDDSDEYLEELNLQAERLKKKGFRVLFSFKDTVFQVVDGYLKKISRED